MKTAILRLILALTLLLEIDVYAYGTTNTSTLDILCKDLSEDGSGSAYNPHSFYLDGEDNSISTIHWNFSLKDKGGNFISVSTGNSIDFTIDKISNPQDYFINHNYMLEGKIECEYTSNEKTYTASPLIIGLEIKPVILSVDNIQITHNDDYSFILSFNVSYIGAEYINVKVEEEHNTTVRLYTVEEPLIAHVQTGNITSLYYSWITIEAKNLYGTTTKTLEYAPQNLYNNIIDTPTPLESEITVELYSLTGNLAYKGTQEELKKTQIEKGIYILKRFVGDRTVSIEKILIQ